MSEASIFQAIEAQRQITVKARSETRLQRRDSPRKKAKARSHPWVSPVIAETPAGVDYGKTLKPFEVEVWDRP